MKRITVYLCVLFMAVSISWAQEEKQEPAAKEPAKEETAEKQSKSTEDYIKDLSSKDIKTATDAAEWLGKKEEKSAVKPLSETLKNDNREKVRLYAAISLGLIADEKGVDALNNALLQDSSADVRYSALLSIVRIGSKESIDTLKAAKEKEGDPFIKDFLKKMEEKLKGE